MCLSPKIPPPPEAPPPPPPAPTPVMGPGSQPTTVKTQSKRASMQQASKGTSSLSIPLSTGGGVSNMPSLNIGKR
jgi:hypothetical protein